MKVYVELEFNDYVTVLAVLKAQLAHKDDFYADLRRAMNCMQNVAFTIPEHNQ